MHASEKDVHRKDLKNPRRRARFAGSGFAVCTSKGMDGDDGALNEESTIHMRG